MSGRIRTIKPELLTDGKAVGLSDAAWRLWVSSWLLADDTGRFPAEPLIVAGQIFPGRKFTEVSRALSEVSNKGFVTLYKVNGEQFGQINGWSRHQKINRPSGPKFPAPCEGFSEDSVSPHGALDADHDRDHDRDHDLSCSTSAQPQVERENFDFESVYQSYPRRAGKVRGLNLARTKIQSPAKFAQMESAAQEMAELWRNADRAQMKFCPQFDTWVSKDRWRDDAQIGPDGQSNEPGRRSLADTPGGGARRLA